MEAERRDDPDIDGAADIEERRDGAVDSDGIDEWLDDAPERRDDDDDPDIDGSADIEERRDDDDEENGCGGISTGAPLRL